MGKKALFGSKRGPEMGPKNDQKWVKNRDFGVILEVVLDPVFEPYMTDFGAFWGQKRVQKWVILGVPDPIRDPHLFNFA